MSKINKILCSLIVVLILLVTSSVNAATIKETVNPDDNFDTIADGTFVIGITKFEPDVIVTGGRVSTATFNDVMFNLGKDGYSGVEIFYYTSGTWFEYDEQNAVSVVSIEDPLYEQINNPDIYYVNNQEKILFAPYYREVADNVVLSFETNNNKIVTYEDNILRVPATVKTIDVYEQAPNEERVKVDSLSKENNNDEVYSTTSYVDLRNSIGAKSNTFVSTYYNEYNNGDLITTVNDGVYYINLGRLRSNASIDSLSIGSVSYEVSEAGIGESKKIGIGHNAFIDAPVWKVVDGNVLVALPWLSADAMPNQDTTVSIGDQKFIVKLYDVDTTDQVITLTSAVGLFNPEGYESNAVINGNTVDFYYTHGTQALGLVLSVGENPITAANQIVFCKDANGDMDIATTENGYTFVVYFRYYDGAITEEANIERISKIAIPGSGVINLVLNGHEVTSIPPLT